MSISMAHLVADFELHSLIKHVHISYHFLHEHIINLMLGLTHLMKDC